MRLMILTTLIGLEPPAPTPTPTTHKLLPHPPAHSPDIFSVIFGNGLTSLLLLMVILVLLAIIVGIFWMFMTGRWITAQTLVGEQSAGISMAARSAGPTPTRKRVLTNQPRMPEPYYPSPPGQVLPPASARDIRFDKDASNLPPTMPGDPLDNKRWLGLVKGCVNLYDELDELFPKTDPRQETANHVQSRLQEILSRSGVEIIARDRIYDVYRHQLEPPQTEAVPGTPIKKIISPGFAVGRLVLRPARVQVAASPVENVENDR